MTIDRLRPMLFMLFDQRLLSDAKQIYERYDYLIEPDNYDLNIIYYISKAFTSKNKETIIECVKKLGLQQPTFWFKDITGLQKQILIDAINAKLIETNDTYEIFTSNELSQKMDSNKILYESPKYTRLSINGNDYDESLRAMTLCETNLNNKEFFRMFINNIESSTIKLRLQIIHSLTVADYEYGYEAVKNLVDYGLKNDIPLNKNNISPYISIIEFCNNFQLSGHKIANTVLYGNIKKLFDSTIYSLSVAALCALDISYEFALKEIANVRKRLLEIGFNKDELDGYCKPIYERLQAYKKSN